MSYWKQMITLAAALMLLAFPCLAEITDAGLTLLGCDIHYPKLAGLESEELQTQVNELLVERGSIRELLSRASLIAPSGGELTVSYEASVNEAELLTCVYHAVGSVDDQRTGELYHAVTIDLRDGHAVTAEELCDPEIISSYILDDILPEMNAHLETEAIEQLPADMTVDETGVTFYYDKANYTTLYGAPGTLHISWAELPEADLTDGSIAQRAGAVSSLTLTDKETVGLAIAGGSFPGLTVRLGDAITDWLPMSDEPKAPDRYQLGRMLSFENGRMRSVFLLTDDVSDDLTNSVVLGVRTDRACVAGLVTGTTTLEDWRAALGEPDATLDLDEDEAEAMRMVPGTSDYYTIDTYRLRLHADTDGILRSMVLMQ